MSYVYLDWNVFNRIEKSEDGDDGMIYQQIEHLILNEKMIALYSNAHINDLIRGYEKNKSFIELHLQTLEHLTKNYCIVQYWGFDEVYFHTRNVKDFFYSALDERQLIAPSYIELLERAGFSGVKELLEQQTIPELKATGHLFDAVFKKTIENPTLLSMCEDIYELTFNISKDYSIYKSLVKYINSFNNKIPVLESLSQENNNPQYLSVKDTVNNNFIVSHIKNDHYHKMTDSYILKNFEGSMYDDKLSNLVDDSLHVFYGSYCDYFVTLDDKCYWKAKKVYSELGIITPVLKPKEFVALFS